MAYVDPKENDANQRETNSHAEEDLQKILNGQHVPVDYITVGLDRIGNANL